jgi:HEAT repeat protein
MSRAFISYVSENVAIVARLADVLEAFDVQVWLDRNRLRPGARWKTAIRQAISDGDFFIACFSAEYQERSKSYMNEELVIAIDELRQRSTGREWFIPVLLNDCDIPDRDIGAGETLRSLQWVNLHADWDGGIKRIISVVEPKSAKLYELRQALNSRSARERIHAADQLGKLGSLAKSAVPALTALLDDPNETVRAATASALGNIRSASDKTIAELMRVMRRGDYYDSEHAAAALAKLGYEAMPALLEASTYPGYGVAHHAREALAQIHDPAAIPALIEQVQQGSTSAIEGLARMGSEAVAAVPVLVDLLNSENTAYQWYAIEALGKIGDKSAVPALTQKLTSDNARTRQSAIKALGQIGDPSVMPLIRERLRNRDDSIHAEAIKAYDWSQDRNNAIATLTKLLEDDDFAVRMNAAEILGSLHDMRAVDSLINALDDDETIVRRAAARALGRLNARVAVPALVRKLGHDRSWVNDSIEAALLEIGSEEAISAVRREGGEGSATGA